MLQKKLFTVLSLISGVQMVGAAQRKMSRTRQCGVRGRERESKGVPVKLFNKSSSVPVYPMIGLFCQLLTPLKCPLP